MEPPQYHVLAARGATKYPLSALTGTSFATLPSRNRLLRVLSKQALNWIYSVHGLSARNGMSMLSQSF